MNHQNIKSVGKFKRSWILLKSSVRVLKLDKELIALPVLSMVTTLAFLAMIIITAFVVGAISIDGIKESTSASGEINIGYWIWPIIFVLSIVFYFITNFFSGAIIYGALERFDGKNPTLKGSLSAARKKWKPILYFSAMMAVVGTILNFLQERASYLPIVGQLIANILISLAGLAWGLANFFSLAHIMADEEELGPVEAMKKSVKTFKGVWEEGVVSAFGLGFISTIVALAIAAPIATGAVFMGIGGMIAGAVTLGVVALICLIIVALVSSALESILKAAVFYYAITGEAPEAFDKKLLHESFTHKKAKKVFGV